jgi:hypothetical protein
MILRFKSVKIVVLGLELWAFSLCCVLVKKIKYQKELSYNFLISAL